MPKHERIAFCVEAEGKLLVLKRAINLSAPGHWELPGGKVKSFESLEISARRQLQRDTSIELAPQQPISFLGSLFIEGTDQQITLHIFALILDRCPTVRIMGEHRDYCWVTQRSSSCLSTIQGSDEILDIYYKWSLQALLKRFIHEIDYDLEDWSSQQLISRIMGNGYTRQSPELFLYHVDINPEKLLEPLFDYFPNIRSLNLYFDDVAKLPAAIGNLTLLEELDLSSNDLTELPESIGNLRNLCTLNLTSNPLIRLPDSIGNLINLRFLRLPSNMLFELPDSLGMLEKLEELFIKGSSIKDLPDSVKKRIDSGKLKFRS